MTKQIIIRPWGANGLGQATIHEEADLPHHIAKSAGDYEVGRIAWHGERVTVAALPTVPGKVEGLELAARSADSLTLRWTTPEDGGKLISAYRLYLDGDLRVGDASSPQVVAGLAPGTQHAVSVAAVNAVGEGPRSDELLVTTEAGSAPILTEVEFDASAEPPELTFKVGAPGTLFWTWTAESAPLTAEAVRAERHGQADVAVGINYLDFGDPEEPGTYWLQFVVEGEGGFSDVAVVGPLEVAAPETGLFSETWSDWATGKTQTDLLGGGWSAGGQEDLTGSIVSDQDAPEGKAFKLTLGNKSDGQSRYLYRGDIADALAAGGWSSADFVALLRMPSTGWSQAYLSFLHGASAERTEVYFGEWGGIKARVETTSGKIADIESSGIGYGDTFWVRVKLHSSDQVSAKLWTGDYTDEPDNWMGTKTGAVWDEETLRLSMRAGDKKTSNAMVLGFWIGLDRDAGVPKW